MKPDLVILGNLLLDDVVYADGRTRMAQPGGATLYVALAARLWGIGVGIVTRLGDDYPAAVLEALAARGVDLAGVRPFGGPGLRTWLLYEGRRRQVVHRLGGPTHAEVSPAAGDVPSDWRGRAFHLAPMPFDVQRRLAGELSRREDARLSLDPYELLDANGLQACRQLLAGVDLLFLSEDEMMIEGALRDPRPVLADLAGGRLRHVVFKRGVRGGLCYDARDGKSVEWAARAASVVDPTGAGDAFAGGVLAGLLRGEPMPRALERGVVAASFALAGTGAEALLAAAPGDAEARWREWFARLPPERDESDEWAPPV